MVVAAFAVSLASGCSQVGFFSANDRTWGGERIEIPAATWIDPDGCEHWIFDTGLEGYMTPKLTRDGLPVCIARAVDTTGEEEVADEGGGIAVFTGITEEDGPTGPNFALAVDAYFDVDSARIRPVAYPELEAFFRYLKQIDVSSIYVEGHTDNQASPAYNLDLSLRRAQAVAEHAARFDIFAIPGGMGESRPAANNASPEGRQRNRRVEIIILGEMS